MHLPSIKPFRVIILHLFVYLLFDQLFSLLPLDLTLLDGRNSVCFEFRNQKEIKREEAAK
jgi:hypothetical protein